MTEEEVNAANRCIKNHLEEIKLFIKKTDVAQK